eukprot:10884043-Lingulodinium_polyedra.AAC.1
MSLREPRKEREEQLVKKLRQIIMELHPTGDESMLALGADCDVDVFLSSHAELVVRILAVMARPKQSFLVAAIRQAFGGIALGVAVSFASMFVKAVSICRAKIRFTKNGQRLAPGTYRIVKLLQGQRQPRCGKLARSLRRH